MSASDPTSLEEIGALAPDVALRRVERERSVRGALRALPHLSALAPELAHALGELALARGLERPFPSLEGLDPAVRASWERARLAADPGAPLDDDALELAVDGWPHADVPMPAALVRRMASHARASIAVCALEGARGAVRGFGMTPLEAREAVEPLAEHGDPRCRRALARALDEGWSRLAGLASLASKLARDPDPAVAAMACGACSRADVLIERARDRHADDRVREAALDALGRVGGRDALELALERSDLPRAAAQKLIVALHRRGIFVAGEQVPALLAVFEADPSFDAATLIRVSFTCRHALVRALDAIGADDPRWVRYAAVLAASEGEGAMALFAARLRETTDREVARALLEASARSGAPVAERDLLRWLDDLPEAAIAALSMHGSDAAVDAIVERLSDPTAFGSARPSAIRLAFRLASDRAGLAARLDVLEVPPDALRAAVDPELAATILAQLAERPALARLEAIASAADRAHFPIVEQLFREALVEETRFVPTRRPRDPSEPLACERAAARYGEQLVTLGRPFSPWTVEEDGAERCRSPCARRRSARSCAISTDPNAPRPPRAPSSRERMHAARGPRSSIAGSTARSRSRSIVRRWRASSTRGRALPSERSARWSSCPTCPRTAAAHSSPSGRWRGSAASGGLRRRSRAPP